MTPLVDPRSERTRTVVLAATAELLCQDGFERITIDAIAERSGVARSTIYRHWPQRHQLFTEAFEQLCNFPTPPDTGTFEDDLRTLATNLARGLSEERWGRTLPSLVGAAAHDDELRTAQLAFNARRRTVTQSVFERAAARGDIAPHRNLEVAVTRFVAPFFFAKLVAHLPLDEAFVEQMVQATVAEVAQ